MNKNRDIYLFKIFVLIILIIFSIGCSVNSLYRRKGIELLNSGEYDKAVVYYSDLIVKKPKNSNLKALLLRAKTKSFYYHISLARQLVKSKLYEKAFKHYRVALALFPKSSGVKREFYSYKNRNRRIAKPVFKSEIQSPVMLNIDNQKIDGLSVKNTSIKKIFNIVGKSYGVNFIFDKDFRDFPYTFEVENIGFFEILKQLCLVTNSKSRIVDQSSVLIYPNTSFKKRNFDLLGVKVFFLSNISGEDAKKLIIPMFRDERIMIQEDVNLNSVIVKGSESTLRKIERFLSKIDIPKSEVEFDVEILEINRTVLNRIGTEFGKTFSTMKIGQTEEDGTINSTFNVNNLKNSNFFLTLPTVALNILGTDDNSKIIAKPNLRGVNGEEIKFMVGDELPIPQTTFQSIAAGGIESSPVTSYQYKNVGVEIKLTPFIHRNGEVTVKIKMTINFVTTYTEQFPVLGKRELENTIRLKEGESSIIGGFIRDEVRGKLDGVPFISRLPIIGRLFGSKEDTIRQTDIIFSITPRFIRNIKIDDEKRKPIWSDTENHSGNSTFKSKRINPQILNNPTAKFNSNYIRILPDNRSVRENNSATFLIGINSEKPVSTLSFSGVVTDGDFLIEELTTDVIKDKSVKVLKSINGSNFDLGYSFFDKPLKFGNIAKIKIKFKQKGNYSIKLNNIYATYKRKSLTLRPIDAKVKVI